MAQLIHTEGEANTSEARADFAARETGPLSAPLLARDEKVFLHQSLSTPCVGTIAKAEGIWIQDLDGRRFMDFHGNSVHHIGYGHPRLVAAVKALDRVLTSGRYVIPSWHSPISRIAHVKELKYPPELPMYGDWIGFQPDVWWYEE